MVAIGYRFYYYCNYPVEIKYLYKNENEILTNTISMTHYFYFLLSMMIAGHNVIKTNTYTNINEN